MDFAREFLKRKTASKCIARVAVPLRKLRSVRVYFLASTAACAGCTARWLQPGRSQRLGNHRGLHPLLPLRSPASAGALELCSDLAWIYCLRSAVADGGRLLKINMLQLTTKVSEIIAAAKRAPFLCCSSRLHSSPAVTVRIFWTMPNLYRC